MREPTHPAVVLKEAIASLGLSVTDAADQLGVTRQQLHRILAQQAGISPEMALRLGRFCGNGETLWLRMQEAVELWHARARVDLSQVPDRRGEQVLNLR